MPIHPSIYLLLSILVYVLSYWGVFYIRRWAQQQQILDIPNARSSHTRPTPSGGGLAIVGSVLVGICIYAVAWG
jgi:Fuc2NAc and GlcNAc transferase